MKRSDRYVMAVLCIVLAGCSPPQDTPSVSTSDNNVDSGTGYDNMRIIVRHATTGELAVERSASESAGVSANGVPSSATQLLSQTEPTAFEQLETTTLDDGTVTVVLDDSFRSPLVAIIDCDEFESLSLDVPSPEESNPAGRECAESARHHVPQISR